MPPKEMFADISSENYPVSAVHPPPSTAAATATATTDVKKESDEKIKTSAKIVGSLLGLCVMGPLGAALGYYVGRHAVEWEGGVGDATRRSAKAAIEIDNQHHITKKSVDFLKRARSNIASGLRDVSDGVAHAADRVDPVAPDRSS
uniref:Uncharacterized protein n=1 Tax=Corethron hystrix TaxID=216773 RepID=A0A7S1BRB5_9STRA|mmetsp:Transcript_35831/g.83507  ORF Transcript_35831/g.83507 Transcript_35831/m.83507 type:complete len:146 (+) Transcript_35831:355-792(+)|eukprot:CAMPEP_0113314690 /NCGR_PEP_ID=MMETSP0010_2-20120614/10645_1 /TAXON_ID=216773 ORGANISM="Corethron hystrix, Strain 308" /NCGR_SAMPLE_ID=MMETSP0010_2 /ASSEMBLY_ACC=CAM_ASM_000155 /LENGTH=145 /DNA_ID=CAMNT_0000171017 /DNA_START=281 /DNA_END=718 /DNA_ORIENTATION=- /assembly_acc=CAM_ASM_000155